MMLKVKLAGVNSPFLLHADYENLLIYMQYVQSKQIKTLLYDLTEKND
jgi:tRNA A-37 threonylcarbamoyl transferase component Bud32